MSQIGRYASKAALSTATTPQMVLLIFCKHTLNDIKDREAFDAKQPACNDCVRYDAHGFPPRCDGTLNDVLVYQPLLGRLIGEPASILSPIKRRRAADAPSVASGATETITRLVGPDAFSFGISQRYGRHLPNGIVEWLHQKAKSV